MKKKEIIIISIIIICSLISIFFININKEKGKIVIVKINGVEESRYKISENGEYILNNGTNIMCINDGKVYMLYANCDDHICINQGEINEIGESIVCLPNRISIIVKE